MLTGTLLLALGLAPTASLEGRVMSRDGTPLPAATVSARVEGSHVTVAVVTDARGAYRLDALDPGAYEIRVRRPGFADAGFATTLSAGLVVRDVTLEPAGDVWDQVASNVLLGLLPDGERKRTFLLDCTGCHQFDQVTVGDSGGGLRTEADWRDRTAQMLGFAGATTGFPIIAPARDAAVTAQWLAEALGETRPRLPPPAYDVPIGSARFTEYELPAAGDLAHDLIVAPDGRIVITGMFTHRMYTLDPSTGTIATHAIPVSGANPRAVEVTPDGTWWVLLGAPQRIARRRDGAWESWEIGMYPHSVGVDAAQRVWFNGHFTKAPELMGFLDPSTGAVTTYEVPVPLMPDGGSTIPYELRIGGDGTVWISQLVGNRLVRVDPGDDRFRLYELPTPHSGPRRFDLDAAGNVWIPEYAANRLARFDPASETFREWRLPMPDALPYVVRVDDRRNVLWIGTGAADALLRFDLATERFTVYPLPTRGALIRHLDIEPESGAVWAAYGAAPSRVAAKVVRLEPRD